MVTDWRQGKCQNRPLPDSLSDYFLESLGTGEHRCTSDGRGVGTVATSMTFMPNCYAVATRRPDGGCRNASGGGWGSDQATIAQMIAADPALTAVGPLVGSARVGHSGNHALVLPGGEGGVGGNDAHCIPMDGGSAWTRDVLPRTAPVSDDGVV